MAFAELASFQKEKAAAVARDSSSDRKVRKRDKVMAKTPDDGKERRKISQTGASTTPDTGKRKAVAQHLKSGYKKGKQKSEFFEGVQRSKRVNSFPLCMLMGLCPRPNIIAGELTQILIFSNPPPLHTTVEPCLGYHAEQLP